MRDLLRTIAVVAAVAIVAALSSCRQNAAPDAAPIALTGEVCQLDSQFMGSVFPMYNGEIFVSSTWLPDEALYIARVDGLNFTTDSLRLPVGDGPMEFRMGVPLLLDSVLLIINNNMGHYESLTRVPICDSDYVNPDCWTRFQLNKLDGLRAPFVTFAQLSDTTILAVSADYFSTNTFSIIDYKNQIAKELDWTPDDGYTGPAVPKNGVYSGNSVIYRSGDKFFYICGEGHYAFIFTLDGDKVQVEKELMSDFPLYKAAANGLDYNINREGPGYTSTATDSYIYLLEQTLNADGETPKPGYPRVNGTKVIVYDWDGNQVAIYEVDRMGESIFVSPDDKYLFVRSHDDDDYDKAVIMRYAMQHVTP